jgi:hypothetical protein
VSTQIAFVAEAQEEVERLLQPDENQVQIPRLAPLARDDSSVIPSEVEGSAPTSPGTLNDAEEDDDADTPIDGVPATTA